MLNNEIVGLALVEKDTAAVRSGSESGREKVQESLRLSLLYNCEKCVKP